MSIKKFDEFGNLITDDVINTDRTIVDSAGNVINPAKEDGNLLIIKNDIQSILSKLDLSLNQLKEGLNQTLETLAEDIKTKMDFLATENTLNLAKNTISNIDSLITDIKSQINSYFPIFATENTSINIANNTHNINVALESLISSVDNLKTQLDAFLPIFATENTLNTIKSIVSDIKAIINELLSICATENTAYKIHLQTSKLSFCADSKLRICPDDFSEYDSIVYISPSLAVNASINYDVLVPANEIWDLVSVVFCRHFTMAVRRTPSILRVIWDPATINKTILVITSNGDGFPSAVPIRYRIVGNGNRILRFTITNGSEDTAVHSITLNFRKVY